MKYKTSSLLFLFLLFLYGNAFSYDLCDLGSEKQCGEYAVIGKQEFMHAFGATNKIKNISADKRREIDKIFEDIESEVDKNILAGPIVKTLDNLNIDISHQHIFFCKENKTIDNIGFAPKSVIKFTLDKLNQQQLEPKTYFKYLSDYNKNSEYRRENTKTYIGKFMRMAVDRVMGNGKCQMKKYFLLGANCQNFVSKVKEEYNKILQEEKSKYKIVKETTAPKGCWCSGSPVDTIISDNEKRNQSSGGRENDGKIIKLSDMVHKETAYGFPSFYKDSCNRYRTETTYCTDPECKKKTSYEVTRRIVEK